MTELPDYVNCKNEEIAHCDFFMHKSCEKTCGYYKDIMGLGIGAICDGGLFKRIEKEVRENY